MVLAPGQKIGGLCVERQLGRGVYGVVHLARDTLLGRAVALKVLPGGVAGADEEARERMLAEARLVGNLNSPHVVTLYRLRSLDDGGWMMEMEYVEGGGLERRLGESDRLELDEALRLFRDVCLALKAAHAARVIHGDIKPENVLVTPDGRSKLADFGLGRLLGETGVAVPLEGQIVGTPAYMAPEVIGGKEAGIASDVWSAAVLFYRALTGRHPFPATTFAELAQAIHFTEPEPLDDSLPAGLETLVRRCLAKAAVERPAAAEIVEELERLARDDERLRAAEAEPEPLTNLAPAATRFVGREHDLDRLGGLLVADGARLVTVSGPGGIGKTRLSQELARRLVRRFEGGCWFADLSATRDADGIAHAVAQALGIPLDGGADACELVAAALAFRGPLLLVLDNFEQVVERAGATVALWLARAPELRVLVTSRILLGLGGERRYDLPPLETPDEGTHPAEAETFAGVRLFVDRARELDGGFALEESNTDDVVRICRELDGMPLAIELAAARVRVLGPGQIAARLNRKFQLLRSTRRDLTPRQKTLEGAIDWSYELLEPWEREVYLQACVFRGGFTLEAAEEVLDLSAFDDAPLALDAVQALCDKSLLYAYETGQETRLGIYGAIREYGVEKWRAEADEERRAALAERHARYHLALAEEWNARMPGPRAPEALDRVDAELDNLAAIHERALERGDAAECAAAALAAAPTLEVRRPPRRARQFLEPALDGAAGLDATLRARLSTHLAAACQGAGDWDVAVTRADAAVALAREGGDARTLARALLRQGDLRRTRGHLDGAAASFAECEEGARAAGDSHAVGLATGHGGMVLWQKGDLDGAGECFVEAVRFAREVGDMATVALHLGNQGIVCESRGELDRAIALHSEAEDLARRIGERTRVAIALGNRANVLVQSGRPDIALRCYHEAERIARELGVRALVARTVSSRGSCHSVRGELAEAVECYAEAEEIARELGERRRIAVTLGQRGNALAQLERHELALACHREAEEIGSEIGDRLIVALNRCYSGDRHYSLGHTDEAWEALRDGIAMYDSMHADRSVWYFKFKATLTRLAGERGDATAATLAREVLDLATTLDLHEDHPDTGVGDALRVARTLAG